MTYIIGLEGIPATRESSVFASLTWEERHVLAAELYAGWIKQSIVYRCTKDGARGSVYASDGDPGLYEETHQILREINEANLESLSRG